MPKDFPPLPEKPEPRDDGMLVVYYLTHAGTGDMYRADYELGMWVPLQYGAVVVLKGERNA